jgi:ABC-type uncharacterized transport system substrate-binding protein
MQTSTACKIIILGSLLIVLCFFSGTCSAANPQATKKVLVVMSYHQGNTWQDQLREGIEANLHEMEIKYFYLDTKRNPTGGVEKAKEAYTVYRDFMPDAVIAGDDNAQSLFVVPYLKDKVQTPVIFMGVNDDAAKYGYPATNVTGIVEKKHIKESLSFAQLLMPGIKKVTVIFKENLSNQLNIDQMQREQKDYPVTGVKYIALQTLAESIEIVTSPTEEADAFFSLNLTGLLDENGNALETTTAMTRLSQVATKPIIGADSYDVESGALCGVIKLGQEQGRGAAHMVLELFQGRSIGEIPITYNINGQRYLNVTTAKRLGITLPSAAVIGAKLIK